MGGDAKHTHSEAHGHGHEKGHATHDHHHHHHYDTRLRKTAIHYELKESHGTMAPFEVPDWRIYKVENAPELVSVQNRLAKLGLKDPWLRNEVWRFDPQFGSIPRRKLMWISYTMGIKWGFILAVGTVTLQALYGKVFGKKDDHGHHGGHH